MPRSRLFKKVVTYWFSRLKHNTHFWESSLSRVSSYRGNFIEKYKEVNAAVNHSFIMEHFGTWLQLWF